MRNAIKTIDIPASCSPFINTNFKPAGRDKETGLPRFWFSCWNHASGSVGALVRADGEAKIFRFDPEKGEHGFYSAQYGGAEDMWLCGKLNMLVHLNLESGEREYYDTGLPADLCGGPLTFDEKSGKLFCWTYCQGDYTQKGFVFDIKRREIIKRFDNLPMTCNTTRFFLKMADGKYIYPANTPDIELYTWDPKTDEVEVIYSDKIPNVNHIMSFVMREDGCIYIPYRGWFNPQTREFCGDERAPIEMFWFAMKGDKVYGINEVEDVGILHEWDRKTGAVKYLHTIANATRHSCAMLDDGRFFIVDLYCFFKIFNPITNSIDVAKKLPMDSVGFMDCIRRVDEDTLLATPFITQRFVKIDLKTGHGYDMGRASCGLGEILQTTMHDGKVYMAAYTKGQLSMWDPKKLCGYPENPLVVAKPGHEAMRPVSMCTGGNTIYYSCSREYGNTGGVLVAYDTQTGLHRSKLNPAGDRILHTLYWDESDFLLAGSTCEADCRCVPAVETACKIAKLSPETLTPIAEWNAPEGTYFACVLGKLKDGRYLISCASECAHCHEIELCSEKWTRVFALDAKTMQVQEIANNLDLLLTRRNVIYAEKPGYFILRRGDVFTLCGFDSEFKIIEDIAEIKNNTNVHVQDGLIYLADRKKIYIYDLGI